MCSSDLRTYNTPTDVRNPTQGANNTVYAVAVNNIAGDPNFGKTYLGGDFTSVNSNPLNRIARVDGAGKVDPTFNIGTGADGYVAALAIQPDGRLLIGGAFNSVNGTNWNGIGRLNIDGSLDTTFNPRAGASGPVNVVRVQTDGKILIAGEFLAVDNASRPRIARLNADGSLDTSFNPGTGADNSIRALELQPNGKIVIAGRFQSFNGTPVPYVARLNTDGSLDTSFAPLSGPDGVVHAIGIQADGRIIFGGTFTSYDGLSRQAIARVTANGAVDTTFYPGSGVVGDRKSTRLNSSH